MNLVVGLLLVLLLLAVAFATYQFSEAQRWRAAVGDARRQVDQRTAELDQSRRNLLEAEVKARVLLQSQQHLEEKFRLLASEALQNNSQLFLDRSRDQMQSLVEPVNQTLKRFEEQVKEIERSRVGAYSEISTQVKALTELQERVRQSTDQLKTALAFASTARALGRNATQACGGVGGHAGIQRFCRTENAVWRTERSGPTWLCDCQIIARLWLIPKCRWMPILGPWKPSMNQSGRGI